MDNVVIIGRFIVFAWVLLFPQLLGLLLYFRLRRLPNWAAGVLTAVAPAVIFIFVAPAFLFAGIREAYLRGERCGMPALGVLVILFAGTILEFAFGVCVSTFLTFSNRAKVVPPIHE